MRTWTRERLRHARTIAVRGRNPAAAVYDSIGPDFFLALDAGWLNLGLWEGDGSDPAEAPAAVRRLVRTLASELPTGGSILDVGNGLGAQDALIAAIARPTELIALNIARSQLVAGRDRLAEAGAIPVNADATRMPLRASSVDGVISVEAAFHFASRERFFAEAHRVLKPGGVITMSDVATQRLPRAPDEVLAGLTQIRVWGLRSSAAATVDAIAEAAAGAGFVEVRTQLLGDRVIAPAIRFVRNRIESGAARAPLAMRLASRAMLAQVELLWNRGVLEYLLLRARKP